MKKLGFWLALAGVISSVFLTIVNYSAGAKDLASAWFACTGWALVAFIHESKKIQ